MVIGPRVGCIDEEVEFGGGELDVGGEVVGVKGEVDAGGGGGGKGEESGVEIGFVEVGAVPVDFWVGKKVGFM